MRLTLRKAAKVRAAIDTAMKATSPQAEINIPVGADSNAVAGMIAAGAKAFTDSVERYLRLNSILAKLRAAIGNANADEIGGLLAQRATLIRAKALMERFASTEAYDETRVKARLDLLAKTPERYGSNEIATSPLSAETLDKLKDDQIKAVRGISDIDDRLQEINAKAEVTLDDADYKYLTENRII